MPPLVQADALVVTMHIWRQGNATIFAVLRDCAATAPDETVTLTSPTPFVIGDLRTNQSLGRRDNLTVTLDAVYPAVLSLTP